MVVMEEYMVEGEVEVIVLILHLVMPPLIHMVVMGEHMEVVAE